MKRLSVLLAAGLLTVAGTASAQQTYSIASNPQGSLAYTTGTAIAKVMAEKTQLQFRVAPFGGSSTYLPIVNRKESDFGLANGGEIYFAYKGTEIFDGRPNPNLRMVGVLYGIYGNFAVPKDSPIKTISDLKGKRIPTEYTSGVIFKYLTGGLLATEGLTFDDVRAFPVPQFVAGIEALVGNRVDAAYIPLNAAAGQTAMARMSNGWRYITFKNSPEAAKAMHNVLPFARPGTLKPSKDLVGVDSEVNMILVDFFIVAGSHVADDVVYQLTKVLHGNKDELVKVSALFNPFDPKEMVQNHETPYHPGAVRFYKEVGQWPPKGQ